MIKNIDDLTKMNQAGLESTMKVLGDWNKGWQAIAAEMSDYSKRSFEDTTATFEKLLGARTMEQALEIQTTFAKRAYEDYVHQMAKISTLYADLAKEAYRPLERVMTQGR